jgi:photosystem II stability/assembly factor-like uncharacterized protein
VQYNIRSLFICAIMFSSLKTQAQWSQIDLSCGTANCFCVNRGKIFAGTDNGVFFSTNHGISWEKVNGGLTETTIYSLVSDSKGNLFAGTAGKGVFFSTNNGASWSPVNKGLLKDEIQCLAVSPSSDTMKNESLFAGTSERGIFRSTDSGTNWEQVNNGFAHLNVHCLVVSKNKQGIIFLFAGTDKGAFFSTNNGIDWHSTITPLGNSDIRCFAVQDTLLLTGTANGGIFISTNNGVSWASINIGLPLFPISTLAISPKGYFFAGTYGKGVFISKNNGKRWSSFNKELGTFFKQMSIIRALSVVDTYLYAGTFLNGIARFSFPSTFDTEPQDLYSANEKAFFYLGVRSPYSSLSSSDLNGLGVMITQTDNRTDGAVIRPVVASASGFEIVTGFSEMRDNLLPFKGMGVEFRYSFTKYNAGWLDYSFNAYECTMSKSEYDLDLTCYFSNDPISFYVLFGFPLSSALNIENGSYRVTNGIVTSDSADATFHGGLFHSGILNFNIGLGCTYHFTKYFSLNISYIIHAIKYNTVSGIMGEYREFGSSSIPGSVGNSLIGPLYVSDKSLHMGLYYVIDR